MELYPHQRKALNFAKYRLGVEKSAYLALAPGLGKTAVALKLSEDYFRVAYICPPSLLINVEREKALWGTPLVEVVPDTKIGKLSGDYDLVIVDEAHRFKNPATSRFKTVRKVLRHADSILLMSGTPMPNSRPLELIPLILGYAKDIWPGMDFRDLAFKYCNPTRRRIGRGRTVWDFNGFSREKEFYSAIQKSWMLRMRKDEIDLPELRETLFFVGKMPRSLDALDKAARAEMKKGKQAVIGNLASYRRIIGVEKAKQSLSWLEQLVNDNAQSVLVFCHHREVVETIKNHFKKINPVVILGGMSTKAKQEEVDRFQKGETKLAILSIGAAGVGLNLTAADRVVMLESSFLDGENEQARDRAYRIGQKNSVLVQHVVLEGSGDAIFLETALKKRDLHIDNF